AATFEIWGALLHGGTLIVVDRDDLLSPEIFGETLRREGATVVFLTTAYFQQVARQQPDVFETPRAVFFGGERCEPDAVRRALDACRRGGTRLFHAYGPSECTTYATVGEVHEVPADATSVPIGGPVANTVAHVVDADGYETPVGVAGELWLGGPGLALTYHDRPRLTAEKFVPDPFGETPGARLYRTGDRVRWLADGTVDFLGRIDHQVKLRGFRIEPGEIEAALEQHPDVADALVMVREDVPGDRQLVGYVSLAEQAESSGTALRAHLGAEMPAYMVPSAVVVLDTWPLTANGKVDRRALPAPERADVEATFRTPETETQALLAELWREALGIDRVGLDDDLFGLGGHSLIAVRLVSRLRDRIGIELPVRVVFESPRLEDLAGEIDARRETSETTSDDALDEDAVAAARERGVLSFGQRRLWFLSQFDPGSTAYNMPLAMTLRGIWERHLLERALSVIVERHAVLRTRYVETAGEPRAVVDAAVEIHLPIETVESTTDLDAVLAAEAATPFDLARGVLRLRLIEPAAGVDDVEPVLLVHVHHIAFDGWSFGLLRRELTALHDALTADPEVDPSSVLPALPWQYADHAARQSVRLDGDRLAALIEPWRQRLAGLESLELPADRARTNDAREPAAMLRRTVPAPLADAVRELARRRHRTLFTTLLAAFTAHLQALTGRHDLAVGVPDAGRGRSEVEGLLGFFVDMVVLRTDLGDDPTFEALVERVQGVLLDARAHAEVPFDKLVEELRPDRELGRNPFFQVAFQVVDGGLIERAETSEAGLVLADRPVDLHEAKFDLTVAVIDGGDRLDVDVIYAARRFDETTVDRWLDGFEHLLDQVTHAPGDRLGRLGLTTAADHEVIVEANHRANPTSTAGFAAGDVSLVEQMRRRAEADPDAVALRCRDRTLSRKELVERADSLARHLLARGVAPGDFVGLCVERGPRLIEGMLGVLTAGAAYVPLDAAYPADRLRFMIEDADLAIVLSEPPLAAGLPVVDGVEILDLDALDLDGPEAPPRAAAELPTVDGDFPAYVIFTSGSTGRPKGTVVPQRGVTRLVADAERYAVGPDDVIAHVASPSFDASTWEIWTALLCGASVAIVDRDDLLDTDRLAATFDRHGVTIGLITTAYFQQLARQAPSAVRRLRLGFFGGERCDPEAIRHALAISRDGGTDGNGTRLFNGYGPTECTVMATAFEVDAVPTGSASIPIGPPIRHTTARVVDALGREVGVGVAGELWLGGPGVAFGYHRRPGLTAGVFVPDPFSDQPGARCYRTGDLVRWLPDGSLDYLGRIDQQVKLRGFRIEPGEIAAMLARHPHVADTVVVVREDSPGSPRLVAYATPADGMHRPRSAMLRDFLAEELPDFMVPAAVVVLDTLPLTPAGKVDRRSLPMPDLDDVPFRPPTTAIEQGLAAIWQEVLGVDRIGLDDDFFALGGHSLLAVRLTSRIRDELGVETTVRTLFEHPRMEEAAAAVEALLVDSVEVGADTIDPPTLTSAIADARARRVLSFGQRRLWFLSRLEPDSAAYNMPFALRLRGRLDRPALTRALGAIVDRHEILRTRYVAVDGEPQAIVDSTDELILDPVAIASTEALDAFLDADARRPFDLEREVFRPALLRLAADDHVLVLTLHHVAFDGWSYGVLRHELASLYAHHASGALGAPTLPTPTVQYADHAARQQSTLVGERLDRQIDHWRRRLAGLEPLDLPTDRPRGEWLASPADSLTTQLPTVLSDRLRALAKARGTTLFTTLLAGLDVLLHALTGRADLAVGVPDAGRHRSELESMLGFFVDNLVLRVDLDGDPRFNAVIDQVRDRFLDATEHADVPFDKLVEELQPDRHLGRNPFFDVSFQVLDARSLPGLDGLDVEERATHPGTAKFDLGLDVVDAGDGPLRLGATWATKLFDRETIERWLDAFRRLLDQLVADPDRRLSSLDLLSIEDTERFAGAHTLDPSYDPSESLSSRFAAIA
ncbi:MAG: amino acid adenylation domain-containing protein, partial [Acidobacteriota bacterium]